MLQGFSLDDIQTHIAGKMEDTKAVDSDGKNVLHLLCASDKEVPTLVLKAIIDANPDGLSAVDSSKKTPLDYAKSNSKLP